MITVYYFDPDSCKVEEFICNKVVAGVEVCTAVNDNTKEQRQIRYIHLLYIVAE